MNEKTVSNFNIDHVLKQKSKNLPNGFVYGVVKGKTEMHEVGKLQLVAFGDKEINVLFQELLEENKSLKKLIEAQKKAILLNKNRIDELERKMAKYGII